MLRNDDLLRVSVHALIRLVSGLVNRQRLRLDEHTLAISDNGILYAKGFGADLQALCRLVNDRFKSDWFRNDVDTLGLLNQDWL